MEDYKVNTNYATALFLATENAEQQRAVLEDMRVVARVCAQNRELGVVMANPTIKECKKAAIIADIFGSSVSRLSALFLDFVVRKRRAVNLRGIAEAYIKLYRERNNIVLTEVSTSEAVDEATLSDVVRLVADYTGKEVEMVHTVDKNMIGGFCMTFENNMYDARMRTQLQKLRREFDKNMYERKL